MGTKAAEKDWPPASGEMAEKVRTFDWSLTPLGPISTWPAELKSAASLVLDNGFPAALAWGPDLVTIYNDAFQPILGNKPEALGRSFSDIWSEAWHQLGNIIDLAFAGKSTFIENFPIVILRSDHPELAYFTFSYCPVRGPDGAVRGIMDTVVETTSQVHARLALRESEERLRLIIENARDYAIFTMDPEGRVNEWREGAEVIFGFSREEIIGRSVDILFTPEDRAHGVPERERAVARETGSADDVRWHIRKGGSRVFIEGVVTVLRDDDGRLAGYLKIGRDATDRHTTEERQKLLLAELQHRVRNVMAMVRSVARRTANSAKNVKDYAGTLDGRISAMARNQVMLTRNIGAGVDLQLLVETELEAQAASGDKFTVTGPPVLLSSKSAEVLSLAVHELATNAAKYGALANSEGTIDIRWEVEAAGNGSDCLHFCWTELGLHLKDRPHRDGFGTELITRRVPYELRGEGKMELRETGLAAVIRFPLEPQDSVLGSKSKGGTAS